ncbi:immunoglobulin-like domain-containing protein [Clostridium facile]|uniref:DUF5011 domain-containing protein n=1 Tax=Clostridium facile TaxID=2763035 RepID=A0ABR7ISZ1_9CLOT|nr:immunoglobulin-like domain-containing protein [Clostridium facile]MBC5788255.1 DUF5011 domain-containing protein [Clostridium facile]PWN00442.1 MAG: phosphohydrolase [Massilioclostridium sp.]
MKKVVNAKRIVSLILVLLLLFAFQQVAVFAVGNNQQAKTEATPVITTKTTSWNYLDNNTKPEDNWKTDSNYDTTQWKTATGSFGAKDGKLEELSGGYLPNTLLQQYIDGKNEPDIPVYYFRTTFDATNLADIQKITGSVLYDDAIVVYVNGQKIAGFDDESFDENGYGGSNASAPKAGKINFENIESLQLKETGNVLAVELHQGRPSSSDLYFDFQELVLDTKGNQPEIKDISLNIGEDETQKNITWYGTSTQATQVQFVVKPEGWIEQAGFPAENVISVPAVQSSTSMQGFQNNKATMYGLKENTTYLYRVGNDEKWSETYSFTTAAFGENASFNFLFAGDPQIGASNTASDTEGWVNTMNRSLQQFPETSFLLSAGDQINDKNSEEEDQYVGFLTPDAMHSLSLATNVGNHDSGSQKYTEHFNMPNVDSLGQSNNTGDGSGDYWFTYNNVLFLSLNSNNVQTAEHKAFMEKVLKEHGSEARWTVVSFHHSIYSVANHYTDKDIQQRRAELAPIFSELGIDVVLMGHDHYYTRTYMMEGGNPVVPEGNDVSKGEQAPTSVTDPEEGQVLYITANSASGSKYYSRNSKLASGMPDYVAVQDQSNRENITNVEVTDNSFTVTTYYTDTDQLTPVDTFTIYKTSQTENPTIHLPEVTTGDQEIIQQGSHFDPMDGVSATDANGNDITNLIQVEGKVDTQTPGSYTLTYSVTDENGNSTSVERHIVVVKSSSESGDNQSNGNSSSTNSQNTSSTQNSTKPVHTGDYILFFPAMLAAVGATIGGTILMKRKLKK